MTEVDHVPWQRELLDDDVVNGDFGDGDDVVDGVGDGGGDVRHLVVGEWIAGKQLWLLSSIRPDQCQN